MLGLFSTCLSHLDVPDGYCGGGEGTGAYHIASLQPLADTGVLNGVYLYITSTKDIRLLQQITNKASAEPVRSKLCFAGARSGS